MRLIAATTVQYHGVFAEYTQFIVFSKLTPPAIISKVALVKSPAELRMACVGLFWQS
jgi:hypothetical protein